MSSIPYLKNHRWLDLTRDERFFCAELYFALKQPAAFNAFTNRLNEELKKSGRPTLDPSEPWEVGLEVAFYRDYIHALGAPVNHVLTHEIGSTAYSRKRTFDLCLFGQDKLVIVEAKVHQGLKSDQLEEFTRDAEAISRLTGLAEENILLVGLWSSRYTTRGAESRDPRAVEFHRSVQEKFDAILHWNDLGLQGPRFDQAHDLFQVADGLFSRAPGAFTQGASAR